MTALVVGVVLNGGGKQSVDEGSLSQSRLSSNLDSTTVSMDHDLLCSSLPPEDNRKTHHNSKSRTPLSDNLVSSKRQLEPGFLFVFIAVMAIGRTGIYTPLVRELSSKTLSVNTQDT